MVLYRSSKLANVLFALELNERLKGKGVTVNAVSPGFFSIFFN
jgi:NAD(P)-dependent dehydrogenase (short-subunit alcohol dehydrogenase family)